MDGVFYCDKCDGDGIHISAGVLKAMRHIIFSDRKKAFSFKLSEQSMNTLCKICERFVIAQTDRNFKTLAFYKEL